MREWKIKNSLQPNELKYTKLGIINLIDKK